MSSTGRWWVGVGVFSAAAVVWVSLGPLANIFQTTTLSNEELAQLQAVQRSIGEEKPGPLPALAYAAKLENRFTAPHTPVRVNTVRLVNRGYSRPDAPSVPPVNGSLGVPLAVEAKSVNCNTLTVSWKPATAEHANVIEYRVYREGQEEPVHIEKVGDTNGDKAAEPYEFTDSSLSPGQSAKYWVKAVAKPTPEKENQKVIAPKDIVDSEGLWVSASSAEATAATPSDIRFACKEVNQYVGRWRANLVFEMWDAKKDKWQEFKTAPGVFEGDEVIGYYYRTPVVKVIRRTGYIVKKIAPNELIYRDIEVEDNDRLGNKVTRIAKVPRIVRYVVVSHPGKKDTRKINIGQKK